MAYVQEPVNPIASRPNSPRAARRASSIAESTAARISRPRSSRTSPAGASSTLRDVKPPGGAAEMALLGYGDEIAQVSELHGSPLAIHIQGLVNQHAIVLR